MQRWRISTFRLHAGGARRGGAGLGGAAVSVVCSNAWCGQVARRPALPSSLPLELTPSLHFFLAPSPSSSLFSFPISPLPLLLPSFPPVYRPKEVCSACASSGGCSVLPFVGNVWVKFRSSFTGSFAPHSRKEKSSTWHVKRHHHSYCHTNSNSPSVCHAGVSP